MDRRAYNVAAFKPFWRWAVALDHRPDLPAIPYYRRAGAEAFMDSYQTWLPDSPPPVLLRRRWFRRVVDVI